MKMVGLMIFLTLMNRAYSIKNIFTPVALVVGEVGRDIHFFVQVSIVLFTISDKLG